MNSSLRNEGLLTIVEVQRQLACGRSKACSLIATRSIPSVRMRRLVRIRKEDLERYIEENRY